MSVNLDRTSSQFENSKPSLSSHLRGASGMVASGQQWGTRARARILGRGGKKPCTRAWAGVASEIYFFLTKQYACLRPKNRYHLPEGSHLCRGEPGIGQGA